MITKIEGHAALALLAPSARTAGPAEPAKVADPESSKAQTPQAPANGFRLRVDSRSHEVVVVVVDPETRKTIREIPAEEMRTASEVIRNLLGPGVDTVA